MEQSNNAVALLAPLPTSSTTECFLPVTDSDCYKNDLISTLPRLFLLEFLGTYIMLVFGMGSVAQVVLNKDNGGSLSIHIAWGLGVAFGVYVSEGGHLNSAITIANMIYNGLSKKRGLVYIFAQFCAGYLAAASVFVIYLDSLKNYKSSGDYMIVPNTAGIFCTFPFSFLDSTKTLDLGFSCLSEFSATFLLYFLVLSFTDEKKKNPAANLTGLFMGLIVLGIGCAYGQQTGYALNPARDFPPRLFLWCAGWGNDLFTYGNYYFWVPVILPILGTITAGGFYETVVRDKNPEKFKVKV